MLLFQIIRDWFVMYIWGGTNSAGEVYACIVGVFNGYLGDGTIDDQWNGALNDIGIKLIGTGYFYEGDFLMYNLADWLSTTSTIIVMVLMCIFLFICVRYLFKVGAGLFSNLRG